MTNASTLNAEATPYNQARNSQERRGRETSVEQSKGPYAVHIRETRRAGKFSSGTCNTNTGMEMLGSVAEKNLLDNKAEVTTFFINDENMKICPHINIKIGN
jgi:hypothetical protein